MSGYWPEGDLGDDCDGDMEGYDGPTCRPVEVDGEVIRVRGDREMNATDREMFAEVVAAAKRKLAEDAGQ